MTPNSQLQFSVTPRPLDLGPGARSCIRPTRRYKIVVHARSSIVSTISARLASNVYGNTDATTSIVVSAGINFSDHAQIQLTDTDDGSHLVLPTDRPSTVVLQLDDPSGSVDVDYVTLQEIDREAENKCD